MLAAVARAGRTESHRSWSTTNTRVRIIGMAFLVLIGLALRADAHNGAVAIAVPVEGIKIDGDLSDWPSGLERYPIAQLGDGEEPKGPKDLQGSFRVGYNTPERVLYVAVEVLDESIAIDEQGDPQAQDVCAVFLDTRHANVDSLFRDEKSFLFLLSATAPRKSTSGASGKVEVAERHQNGTHQYEWRINVEPKEPDMGRTLGFDVGLVDKDLDGSLSYMNWSGGSEKWVPFHLGDLVLPADGESLGTLKGQLRQQGATEGVSHTKVRVQSQSSSSLWIQLETDQQGEFSATIPAGSYAVSAGRQEQIVELPAGGEGRVELQAPTPQGAKVSAGNGRSVLAGSGTRQGPWQSFGVGDGLPPASVSVLLQDRQGRLWLGTGRTLSDDEAGSGVVCYDGVQFTTFTTAEGLAGNTVLSIAEDRQGNLWFGTTRGVSRYDGQQFTNFTTQDGLAGNRVLSIGEDRQGNLWFGIWEGGVSRYDGRHFRNFTVQDGLAGNEVAEIVEDKQGNVWFATWGSGVSRYDGQRFKTFGVQDGLADTRVTSIGEDSQGNLWFGTWKGVSRYDRHQFTTFTERDGLAENSVMRVVGDKQGRMWFTTWQGGVSSFDGKTWVTFTTADGLTSNSVLAAAVDKDGGVWFGGRGGGVSHYNDRLLSHLTTHEGLADNTLLSVLEDRKGNLWFPSLGGKGLSRYDGKQFRTFTTRDGLASNTVVTMAEDKMGRLWFGASRGAVSSYDGRHFRTFTAADGLAGSYVYTISEDRRGTLWFGTWGGGLSRFDGQHFKTFTTADGLANDYVNCIMEDRQGMLWIGTWGGLCQYDGQQFKTFTAEPSLSHMRVCSILEDRVGSLWFGTWGGGVIRYDGQQFKTFTTKQGLSHNRVLSILEDQQGTLWFGTWGGGVTRFDGQVFQHFLRKDGLIHDVVQTITQARNGDVWIATEGGATRYRTTSTPPAIRMTNVTAGHPYGPVSQLSLSSAQDYLLFEFQGASLQTPPQGMVYVYRLDGYEPEWRQTRESRVEYRDLPLGEYTFQVKAVDRDLNYSEEPARVQVTIVPPYAQLATGSGLVLALAGLTIASAYAIRRRRERDQARETLVRELEDELQTAHDLQMGLMPKSPPHISGLDIAGQCIPANHVGGDFFHYFQQENTLSLCLADVTGHAMEAAVPGLMFSGVLKSQVELGEPLDLLFQRLNRTLHSTLDARTFVCFAMGQYDPASGIFRLADAGCPYPYHYRAATGTVEELRVEAYPLGVRAEGRYPVIQTTLAPGDRVVFCSDGIIEATNEVEEMFGFERTAEIVLKGCIKSFSAEALLARILAEVKAFSGTIPQGDDQTVVVLAIEAKSTLHPDQKQAAIATRESTPVPNRLNTENG